MTGAKLTYDVRAGVATIALSTQDIQEGVRAFFDTRDPVWTGR